MDRTYLRAWLAPAALAAAGCAADPGLARTQADLRPLDLSPGTTAIAEAEGQVDLLDDQRVVCERYKPLGSNLTKVRCQTVTEKTRSDEANAREARKLQTAPPSADGTMTRAPWDRGR